MEAARPARTVGSNMAQERPYAVVPLRDMYRTTSIERVSFSLDDSVLMSLFYVKSSLPRPRLT